MNKKKDIIQGLAMRIAYKMPIRQYLLPKYRYMFTPNQLLFMCECIRKTSELSGAILEIGCEKGNTTIFLNKYMDSVEIEKRYICIDTFKGFIKRDVKEEALRDKQSASYSTAFKLNKQSWFMQTMKSNNVSRVTAIEADIVDYDMNNIGNISFCLIDVDLYLPVSAALRKVCPLMQKGGIIIVDDCKKDHEYDGALQAYQEWVRFLGVPEIILYDKLGIIEI